MGIDGLATRNHQSKRMEEYFSIFFSKHFSIFHFKKKFQSKKSYGATWRNYIRSLKYETNILILLEVPPSVKVQTKNRFYYTGSDLVIFLTIICIPKTNQYTLMVKSWPHWFQLLISIFIGVIYISEGLLKTSSMTHCIICHAMYPHMKYMNRVRK